MPDEAWAEALVGRTIGSRYRLDKVIGVGGMGAVFVATNTSLGRRVAVKLMTPVLARNAGFVERFRREAQSASSVAGPGVVDVLDLDVDPAHGPYMVMELIEGEPLTLRLEREGRLSPVESVGLMLHILETLDAVHRAGVVHRDLKPDNVILTRDDRGDPAVKILDFGVAKIRRAARETIRLTMPGTPVGTPRYMSPEQARAAEDVDHRADIYAAGLILYGCLSGEPPYGNVAPATLIQMVLAGPPRPLRELCPGLSEALYAIVDRCLARDPYQRFSSAWEMAEALRATPEAPRASLAPASTPSHAPYPASATPTPQPASGSRGLRTVVIVGGVLLALLALGAAAVAAFLILSNGASL